MVTYIDILGVVEASRVNLGSCPDRAAIKPLMYLSWEDYPHQHYQIAEHLRQRIARRRT